MKKLIALIAIVCLIFVYQSVLTRGESVDISLNYEPYPARAGDVLKLEFEIKNNEAQDLNLTLELDADEPFNLVSNKEKTIYLKAFESKVVGYKVLVDPSAEEGRKKITLKYKTNETWNYEHFYILIAPKNVYLEIVSISRNPEKVRPGKEVELKIRIKNTANSEIKNVVFNFDIKDLPFASQSVTEQRIASLDAKEEKEVLLKLFVLADAEIKTYKIPLKITYEDSYGQSYAKNDTIALQVYEEPRLELSIDSKLIIQKPSKVQVKVLNKGLGDIMFVEIKLLSSSDYDIIQGYEYIGKISSDDYDTTEFQIIPKKNSLILKLLLNYRDSNNQEYTKIEELPSKVYTISEAQKAGLLPKSHLALTLIIIFLVAAIFIWRVVSKKRKQNIEIENA
ncbi:MAG: hypothetical protein QXI41_01270 [Candidatus Pacearchaeota archaeon]